MLISLLLVALIAFSGLSLTYLVAADKPLLWRLAVGNIVGCAVWGMAIFTIAFIGGFNTATVAISFIISLLPAALLLRRDVRSRFDRDLDRARGRLQGSNTAKTLGLLYYAGFFILFCAFFSNAVYELKDGIYTGGSQNLGDLPFHLGAIFSFTDGANFPPQNPSWAGAKFSYPFISDLLTACLVKLGASVSGAVVVQDVSWAFSLLIIVENFAARLTGSKLAGRIAPVLLFFSGGLNFIWALKDYSETTKGLMDFLWHLPHDYTIADKIRWGNTMTALFMTQRSILLGMPLTLIVLAYLWSAFAVEEEDNGRQSIIAGRKLGPLVLSALVVGLLAGTLPLIHLHSLAVLFVVTAVLFFYDSEKWAIWISFGIGVALVAIPQLAWTMVGSATETSKFFGWHFGWDKGDVEFFWFWFTNTGLLFPILAIGIWLLWRRAAPATDVAEGDEPKKSPRDRKPYNDSALASRLLLFYIPFALLFVICNVVKLAPWEWDNIKVLIYWFVGSVPIMALVIAWMWQRSTGWRVAAGACVLLLTLGGALDVWRTASGQVKMRILDNDAMALAQQLKEKTDKQAVFLNAPTYNSAVLLSGRPSLMRYSGHLSSYGIDYLPREQDVKRIYEGGGVSDMLLRNYNVDYVLVSPEERNALKANEEYFKKFPLIAQSGEYRVYKIK